MTITTNPRARTGTSPSTRHFARHYAEMVLAMLLGMAVLWMPAKMALEAFGMTSQELHDDAPALLLLVMATTMTVPMVAWMRFRGHGWPAALEMSASMYLPTFAVIAVLATDRVEDLGALMTIEHVAMLLSMLAAMLLRRAEYTGHAHVVTA
jgi:hypothetical protein